MCFVETVLQPCNVRFVAAGELRLAEVVGAAGHVKPCEDNIAMPPPDVLAIDFPRGIIALPLQPNRSLAERLVSGAKYSAQLREPLVWRVAVRFRTIRPLVITEQKHEGVLERSELVVTTLKKLVGAWRPTGLDVAVVHHELHRRAVDLRNHVRKRVGRVEFV